MIERRPSAAAEGDLDLIVVGGGIHGACLTLEAARRGLSTLLLERDDFGGATSWNSLRIIHGGLRYLQRLDLARYRESVAERHWFMRNFPDQISRLTCLMPLHGRGLRRPSVFAAALALDDLLSRGRNRGLPEELALEAGRTLSPRETIEIFPAADSPSLSGAALWNDAFMPHSPRVLIEVLRWAAAAGAQALNYFEVDGLSVDDGNVTGVTATDRETGRRFEFGAPRVVNCAGPWSRELSAALDREVAELFRPILGFNLLLDCPPPTRVAVAVSPPEFDRSYFLVPWRNRLMAGTHYAPWDPERPEPSADAPEVRAFLAGLAAALPGLGLERSEVLRVMWGRLPSRPDDDREVASRAVIRRHADLGGPVGLVSTSGVKYTTARALAETTLAVLFDGDPPPRHASPRPLPARWPSLAEIETADAGNRAVAERLARLASSESVVQLEDLLLRRTDLGLDPSDRERVGDKIARMLSTAPTAEVSP